MEKDNRRGNWGTVRNGWSDGRTDALKGVPEWKGNLPAGRMAVP
jgi:hypothetical protein